MSIIIVDNDCSLLKSLSIILQRFGHSVKCFDNASEALEYIICNGEPDCIITDYMMPCMDGMEFIETLHACISDKCRIMLMSGHTDLITEKMLSNLGIKDFIRKPVDIMLLKSLLNKI